MEKICITCKEHFTTTEKKQKYCSRECAASYSPAERAYIIANYGKMTSNEIAYELNKERPKGRKIKWRNIVRTVSHWRKAGMDGIPPAKGAPLGTMRKSYRNGKEQYHIKTETGWKYVPKEKPLPQPKEKPMKTKTDMSRGAKGNNPNWMANNSAKRRRRANEVVYKDKPDDLSQKQRIYIPELKMNVYADVMKTPEEVIAKYTKQHKSTLAGYKVERNTGAMAW